MLETKIEKIEKITVDGVDYATTDLTPELKHLVSLYEETFARTKDLERETQVMKYSMQQMGSALVQGIQQQQAAAVQAAAVEMVGGAANTDGTLAAPDNVVPIVSPVNTGIAPATGSANAKN
jgi:hypothetical protein